MPTGRPPKYTNPEELEALVDEYIAEEKRPTLAGLAFHLGMDRKTLYNYRQDNLFFPILKKGVDYITQVYEDRLIYSDRPTGVIFALKNMGMSDRQEVDTKLDTTIRTIFVKPEELESSKDQGLLGDTESD